MNDVNTGMLKTRVIELVNEHAKLAQVVNDSLFSFGELGFHEVETSQVSDRARLRTRTASRWSAAWPACRPDGWHAGAPAGR